MKNCIIINTSRDQFNGIDIESPFFDANGMCLGKFPEKDENFMLSFENTYHNECAYNLCILYIDKESKKLIGWYSSATAYLDNEEHHPTGKYYNVSCKTQNAYLLDKRNYKTIPFLDKKKDPVYILNSKMSMELLDFIKDIKLDAQFVDISLDIKKDYVVENENIDYAIDLYDQYNESGDASILLSIYHSALKWSIQAPDNYEPWDYLGFALMNLAKPEEALVCLEKVIKMMPTYEDPCIDKGLCLIRLEKYKEAISWYNHCCKTMPSDYLKFHLALAYISAYYFGVAYQIFKEITDEEIVKVILPIMKDIETELPYLEDVDKIDISLVAYPLYINFKDEPLPELYTDSNNVERYVDPVREKGIPVTPEETVRQKVISYLITKLNIPNEYVLVEESLSHWDSELRDRVDILVRKKEKNLLLIECKAPSISLAGEPLQQLLRYHRILATPFLLLTNGDESYAFYFDKNNGQYEPLRDLPNYQEMCKRENISIVHLSPIYLKRPEFKVLYDPKYFDDFINMGVIGEDTPQPLIPFILNLHFCLKDTVHHLQCPIMTPTCQIIKDHGLIKMSSGNPGGGTFKGKYRWFSVIDRNGNQQNIYMCIFGVAKTVNHPHWGNRVGRTTLFVATEEKGKAVSRLEISLDTCLKASETGFRLTHSGIRSRKKTQPLLDYIEIHHPELLGDKEKINLGVLDSTSDLYLSQSTTKKVIANIISYTLCRVELAQMENYEIAV